MAVKLISLSSHMRRRNDSYSQWVYVCGSVDSAGDHHYHALATKKPEATKRPRRSLSKIGLAALRWCLAQDLLGDGDSFGETTELLIGERAHPAGLWMLDLVPARAPYGVAHSEA
jgi:hypothetical protein